MKLSLVYKLQMPRLWSTTSERDTYMQALQRIKLGNEMSEEIVAHFRAKDAKNASAG